MFESIRYSVWQEGSCFVYQSFTKMGLGNTLDLCSYSDYINTIGRNVVFDVKNAIDCFFMISMRSSSWKMGGFLTMLS